MTDISIKNKIRGSLIGGAIGDALGYPVEFMSLHQIKSKYGDRGITRYELNNDGVAEISDDTQMTLFTATGLLFGYTRGSMRGIMASPWDYIQDAYIEWLQTQTEEIDYTKWHCSWIREIKELHSQRAPGSTCLQALQALANQQEVKNNSKGCGGVMRIAPVPLFYSKPDNQHFPKGMMEVAGEAAMITHKHPLGYLPAALLSHLIGTLTTITSPTTYDIACILDDGIRHLRDIYPADNKDIDILHTLLEKVGRLAISSMSDSDAIEQIGEGWTAEETLAIAVFCVMRYPNNFEKAIIASVNHSGDSDSTGAVTGNIIGCICGYDSLPSYFKDNLELRWLIEELADDISCGIPVSEYANNDDTPEKRRWLDKYVYVMSKDQTPTKNSYQVDSELNIYAGEYPGDKSDDICRTKLLSWNDFYHFFDLTEDGELKPYSQFLSKWQQHHRFPIPDCGVPSSTSAVRRLIEDIINCGEQGKDGRKKVYIHCWGGVGRTGTIVACLYAYQLRGKDLSSERVYELAMQRLYESFNKCPKSKHRTIPDTKEQCLFIKKFAEEECK